MVGVAMRIGSSLSVNGPIARVVEIASRPAPSAHCLPREDGREPVEEARDDEVWGDDACAVAVGTACLSLKDSVAAPVGGSAGRRHHEAHNSAVEQTAGSPSLAAAAHRERSAACRAPE